MDGYESKQVHRHRGEKKLSELMPALSTRAKCAAAFTAALIPLGLYTTFDVKPMRERLALTQPELVDVYEASEEALPDRAVIDMVGLGNLSAVETATNLTSLSDLGDVIALRYDNRGIDTDVIARTIETKMLEEDYTAVVLVGHSMGGDVALKVAQYIYEDTDIQVDAVVLDCTPPDRESVRQDERHKGDLMLKYLPIIPGGDVARTVRYTVEMGARKDRFIVKQADGSSSQFDAEEFKNASKEVYIDKIYNQNAATSGLIETQYAEIVDGESVQSLHALGKQVEDKYMPKIVYMRPEEGWRDGVTDVDRATGILQQEVGIFEGRLLIVTMQHTGHANPNQVPEEYNSAFSEKIVPYIHRYSAHQDLENLPRLSYGGIAIMNTDE
jgi:pimeloyl-ACP methyl ester carboxylesterase